MPASLPGSTLAQNKANPSAGLFVIFDPLSGPKGSPFDKDLPGANQCSTGALSTGIGFGDNDVLRPGNAAAIFRFGFNDNQSPGLKTSTYTAPPPNGVVATEAVNSTMMYIGGGKCTANVGGVAPAVPYTAGVAIAGAGNGGARDGGAGPAFQGFGMKMVTATGAVANGAVIETGFVNRSGQTMQTGESAFGSAVAAIGAPA